MNKGELIGELKAKATSVAVKEFTPQEVRIEQDQQGMISGKYTAQHIETAHILLSQDRSGTAEGLAMEFTPEGDSNKILPETKLLHETQRIIIATSFDNVALGIDSRKESSAEFYVTVCGR
jgi:hypothetical protein